MPDCDACGGSGQREVILVSGRDGITNEKSEIRGTQVCTACDGEGTVEPWEGA